MLWLDSTYVMLSSEQHPWYRSCVLSDYMSHLVQTHDFRFRLSNVLIPSECRNLESVPLGRDPACTKIREDLCCDYETAWPSTMTCQPFHRKLSRHFYSHSVECSGPDRGQPQQHGHTKITAETRPHTGSWLQHKHGCDPPSVPAVNSPWMPARGLVTLST